MEQAPIDEVLRDYARPFLGLGSSASQAALDYAALIWDLVVDGLTAPEIVDLFEELEPDRPSSSGAWARLVEAFVQRKLVLFPDDRRYARASRMS